METPLTCQCHAEQAIEALRRRFEKGNPTCRVVLPTGDGFDFVRAGDIVYFQASGNYTNLYLRDGGKNLLTCSLKKAGELLADHPFCRIHNSFLINLEHLVRFFRKDGGAVEMSNGMKLPVAKGKKEELLRMVKGG